MPLFCGECGTVLKLDAKFCKECGMKTSSLPARGLSFQGRAVLVAAVSLTLILSFIAFLFFAKNSSGKMDEPIPPPLSSVTQDMQKQVADLQERLRHSEEATLGASREVEVLRAKNVEHESNFRKVMEENQRFKGFIGREQACQDALNICQSEKKNLRMR